MRRVPAAVCRVAPLLALLTCTQVRADVVCDVTIPATMVDTMDSAHSYPGERFRFKTTEPAKLGGIDIAAGTQGWGVVRYVQAARAHNRGGLIVLEPRFIVVGESHLAVMSDPRETAEFAHSLTLTEQAIGMAPLGLFGTVLNVARAGTNVTLGPGYKFHVVIMGDIIVSEPCRPIPHETATPPSETRRQSTTSPAPSPSPEQR